MRASRNHLATVHRTPYQPRRTSPDGSVCEPFWVDHTPLARNSAHIWIVVGILDLQRHRIALRIAEHHDVAPADGADSGHAVIVELRLRYSSWC